jgi:hypothetical protein
VASFDSVPPRPFGRRLLDLGRRSQLALWVAVSRWQLDEELATGADPHSRPALALRASQLLRPRFRRKVARALERVVQEVDGPPSVPSAAVPIQRDELALARDSLVSLAQEIDAAETAQPQGIAMAWKLITDSSSSPVYRRTERGVLLLQAESARARLLGGNGCQERRPSPHSSPAAASLRRRVRPL